MKFISSASAIAIFSLLPSVASIAATVTPADRFQMLERVKRTGSVPVDILLTSKTPGDIFSNYESFKKETFENAEKVIAELGNQALPGGLKMGMGSMNIWVTEAGLEKLQKSKIAVSMIPGSDWNHHTLVGDVDGSLRAVDALLKKDGTVEVEVTFNVDGADFDIDRKSGKAEFRLTTDNQKRSATEKANSVFNKVGLTSTARGARNNIGSLTVVDTSTLDSMGRVTIKANEIGLADLAKDTSVRSIRPVGYVDSQPTSFDKEAFDIAEKNGKVQILVQLRSPYAGGKLTPESTKSSNNSNKRMLTELFSPYKLKVLSSMEGFGAALVEIDKEQLSLLAKTDDKRLWSFVANKPYFNVSLSTSIPSMNLDYHHGLGRLGAGQLIAVLDSGVRKSHELIKSGGLSKVIYEGCYQTNSDVSGEWRSQCPSQNAAGDSPFGLTDSGEPMDPSVCVTAPNPDGAELLGAICNHGTHIAGIAAGKSGLVPLTGAAPEASIASLNVLTLGKLSPVTGTGGGIKAHVADVVQAMYDLHMFYGNQPGNQPLSINLSLGENLRGGPYDYDLGNVNTFSTSVSVLRGKNIPVIAAMGNNNNWGKMNEPASVNGVIKVGSVKNNVNKTSGSSATNISPADGPTGSNRVRPSNWPGQFIFFAPGGQDFPSGIQSAYAFGTNTQTKYLAGTSMATPHVVGAYAVLKAFDPTQDLDTLSRFIRDTYSVPFDAVACTGTDPQYCDTPQTGLTTFRFVFFKS